MNYKEMYLKGMIPENLIICDAHAHIEYFPGTATVDGTPDGLLYSMEKIGIKESAISSTRAIVGDFITGNNTVMEAVEKSAGKIKGYVTVNPNYENGVLEEIKRCRKKGMVGVKIHPSHCGTAISSPLFDPCYKYADENGTIVLIHTWSAADVMEMEKIIKKYPGGKFIIAHSGVESGYPLTAEIIKTYENAYCDFCMGMPRANILEHLVKYGDENKILYGTDFPISDQRISYARTMLSDIPDSAKEKIMGLNYLKLFSDAEL